MKFIAQNLYSYFYGNMFWIIWHNINSKNSSKALVVKLIFAINDINDVKICFHWTTIVWSYFISDINTYELSFLKELQTTWLYKKEFKPFWFMSVQALVEMPLLWCYLLFPNLQCRWPQKDTVHYVKEIWHVHLYVISFSSVEILKTKVFADIEIN